MLNCISLVNWKLTTIRSPNHQISWRQSWYFIFHDLQLRIGRDYSINHATNESDYHLLLCITIKYLSNYYKEIINIAQRGFFWINESVIRNLGPMHSVINKLQLLATVPNKNVIKLNFDIVPVISVEVIHRHDQREVELWTWECRWST